MMTWLDKAIKSLRSINKWKIVFALTGSSGGVTIRLE